MAVFDPKQVSVLINDWRISDWADGTDVIDAKFSVDHGSLTIGAGGTGVFVQNPDDSGTLALKVKQHTPDNVYLDTLRRLQRANIKAFIPLQLSIRDLLNEDVVTGVQGFFTTPPEYVRGTSANPTTWTFVFGILTMRLERGLWE
jgi:hypothetical protein